MLEVRKKVYDIISTSTGYEVFDYPQVSPTYPSIRLTTSADSYTKYKNSMSEIMSLTIDIFSNYKGEAELYNLEALIRLGMDELYDIPQVIYVQHELFTILNDINPALKHGVIRYRIQTVEV